MRYFLLVFLAIGLASCGFMDRFQQEFDSNKCTNDVSFAMTASGMLMHDTADVRSALDRCKDIKQKTPAVKKAIARAEVCLGEYDAAAVIIKEYPNDLKYLEKIIAEKKSKPHSYRCMTNIADKQCIKYADDLNNVIPSQPDPLGVCDEALIVCKGVSEDTSAIAAKNKVNRICGKQLSCLPLSGSSGACLNNK